MHGANKRTDIQPESVPLFSSALVMNNFTFTPSMFSQSWSDLGFSDLLKTAAIGRSGRGLKPELLSWGYGQINESVSQRKILENDLNTKNELRLSTKLVSAMHTHDVTSNVNGDYSGELRTESYIQKSVKNNHGNETKLTDRNTMDLERLKSEFYNKAQVETVTGDNEDRLFDLKGQHGSSTDKEESTARYRFINNKLLTNNRSDSNSIHSQIFELNNKMSALKKIEGELNNRINSLKERHEVLRLNRNTGVEGSSARSIMNGRDYLEQVKGEEINCLYEQAKNRLNHYTKSPSLKNRILETPDAITNSEVLNHQTKNANIDSFNIAKMTPLNNKSIDHSGSSTSILNYSTERNKNKRKYTNKAPLNDQAHNSPDTSLNTLNYSTEREKNKRRHTNKPPLNTQALEPFDTSLNTISYSTELEGNKRRYTGNTPLNNQITEPSSSADNGGTEHTNNESSEYAYTSRLSQVAKMLSLDGNGVTNYSTEQVDNEPSEYVYTSRLNKVAKMSSLNAKGVTNHSTKQANNESIEYANKARVNQVSEPGTHANSIPNHSAKKNRNKLSVNKAASNRRVNPLLNVSSDEQYITDNTDYVRRSVSEKNLPLSSFSLSDIASEVLNKYSHENVNSDDSLPMLDDYMVNKKSPHRQDILESLIDNELGKRSSIATKQDDEPIKKETLPFQDRAELYNKSSQVIPLTEITRSVTVEYKKNKKTYMRRSPVVRGDITYNITGNDNTLPVRRKTNENIREQSDEIGWPNLQSRTVNVDTNKINKPRLTAAEKTHRLLLVQHDIEGGSKYSILPERKNYTLPDSTKHVNQSARVNIGRITYNASNINPKRKVILTTNIRPTPKMSLEDYNDKLSSR